MFCYWAASTSLLGPWMIERGRVRAAAVPTVFAVKASSTQRRARRATRDLAKMAAIWYSRPRVKLKNARVKKCAREPEEN